MTGAELTAWQRRCGLRTDRKAASVLGLHPSTYHKKRHDRLPILKQDILCAAYYEVFSVPFLALSEALRRVHSLTSMPLAPTAAKIVVDTLEEIGVLPRNGRNGEK